MMTADKEARDLKAKQCNPFALTCMPLIAIPIKLRYSIDVGARRIVLRQPQRCAHKYSHCISELAYMHRIVALLIVRPLMSQEPGVAWLELLVAFEAHGGKLEAHVAHRALEERAKPAKLMWPCLVFSRQPSSCGACSPCPRSVRVPPRRNGGSLRPAALPQPRNLGRRGRRIPEEEEEERRRRRSSRH